jgi:hypothetical protein
MNNAHLTLVVMLVAATVATASAVDAASAPPTPWNGVATRLPAAPPRPPRLGGEPSASALALHPSTRIIMPTDIPTPDLLTMQRAIEAVEGGADAWNGPHYGKAQITCVVVRDWLKETRGIGFADEPYLRLMAEGHYDEIVFWHLTRLAAHHKLRARCATPRDLLEAIAAAWNRGVTGYLASPLAAQDYAARVANMYEHILTNRD